MNIRIDTIRIAGFRGIENIEMSLPRITLLIGTNNSGKTSIIKALQLALGDYGRNLNDEDFYIDSHDQRIPQIVIDIRIIASNVDGSRQPLFDDEWSIEFGDKIQADLNGHQFLAIRTVAKPDNVKGGFSLIRHALLQWPEFDHWRDYNTNKNQKISKRYDSLPFIAIEAQRDIHQDLKE